MRQIAIASLLLIAACENGGLADQVARDQAKKTVNGVLSEQFPGVPLEPAANCLIDNASAQEILRLARASVTGLGPAETEIVIEIASRPETLSCLLKDGIAPFLLT